MYPFANFIKHPFSIADLRTPCLTKKLKRYKIVKKIAISNIDYDNFISDLCVERDFIKKNKLCCFIHDNVYHCIYVHKKNSEKGILIMPDGADSPTWVALV